ncbi:hypothetical protein [Bergeyella sp. RCAD1439]|uniref:hypothetical protein n=1 Tax=Bergeyella anatis TaxID=3113737 RepID=UPI002E194ADC|nr:hypothetical protein [Bergeyella sp. RCAD1439]
MRFIKRGIILTTILLGIVLGNAQVFSWSNPNLSKDSLSRERLLRAKFDKDWFTKDTLDFITRRKQNLIEDKLLLKPERQPFLGQLHSKGAITRGITFGSHQGSSVQSTMDLQIAGRISQDVRLLASISDHNLPIQADGYTQTLEEFDKIYIQLNIKENHLLRAGHIDLSDQQTYFAKFQRRSMGLEFQTRWGNENQTTLESHLGVARSEFHRIRFQGIEGNQGPYRLLGKNGEAFITLISGSEQVFIDGILMKRGENADYTINYNTGEVTFTSFRPIYSQNFITVSYNYTNRNYSRFLVTGGIKHERSRLRANLRWFMESDNKNAPLALSLSKDDEKILASAGNNPALMWAPSGVATKYDPDKILYRLIVSPSGNHYEFSTDENEALYQVTFTHMGAGNGDYRLAQSTNNGRVFRYVGTGNGDYAALRKLPAPQKTQVLSTSIEYDLNNGKIGADFSFSNHDLNRFSSLDNRQNQGFATRIYGQKAFKRKQWSIVPSLEFQHLSHKFHVLDRINDVEFARDFNLSQEFSQRNQNRLTLSLPNRWENGTLLDYRLNHLNEEQNYQGLKQDIQFDRKKNSLHTKAQLSLLNTKGSVENTTFARGKVSAEWLRPKGQWEVGAAAEHNLRLLHPNATYTPTSFSWKEAFIQKRIGDSSRTKLMAKIYLRDNDSLRDNRLQKVNRILGLVTESQIIKTEKAQLSAQIHYRKLNQTFPSEYTSNPNFIVGNLLYHQQLFRNGLRLQAFYELGNGQEAQREFQYLRVTDGQGVYKWTDYNGDGIQQLDEFEIAEYADRAQYIRIYTNTVRYLPSNKNKFQLSVFLLPSALFQSDNAFLKRWNLSLSLLSQNAFLKGEKALVLNPFERQNTPILKNQNLLAAVQFNATDKSGWNAGYRYSATENVLNANFSLESTQRQSHQANLGYRLHRHFRIDWENTLAQWQNSSEMFLSKNYLLHLYETKPKATYKLSSVWQAELSSALKSKVRKDGTEHLNATEITGTLQWEHPKTSVRAQIALINNVFTGQSFSIVGNQMLDGLRTGKNQVWSLFFQQKLTRFILLNLNYEGRNSGETTIHTGSMQIKASF